MESSPWCTWQKKEQSRTEALARSLDGALLGKALALSVLGLSFLQNEEVLSVELERDA